MRSLLLALALISLAGCSRSSDDRDRAPAALAAADVPTITIDELDAALARHACQAVDANGAPTRHNMGVIPGAVLLSDFDAFTPTELPADKAAPLVFYCANTSCGASHHAAAKALAAGYTNVKVLPDGIAGWVKAGKQIQKI
jgi:rhodanese-related sulfurtransferase